MHRLNVDVDRKGVEKKTFIYIDEYEQSGQDIEQSKQIQ